MAPEWPCSGPELDRELAAGRSGGSRCRGNSGETVIRLNDPAMEADQKMGETIGALRARSSPPPTHVRQVEGLTLHTVLQPVISLGHCKAVGHEALLRATDSAGRALSACQALRDLEAKLGADAVDALCRELHVATFASSCLPGWLLLNVSPRVIQDPHRVAQSHAAFWSASRLPPYRVVIEIVETRCYDEGALAESVARFRELGCLVAIDDFGAGQSNFERIWRIRPDIVKLDRAMVEQAASEPLVRRVLPGLVSLLHEAECLVVLEGIEDEEQAIVALECDADLVQGFYFGEPSVGRLDSGLLRRRLDDSGRKFRGLVADKTARDRVCMEEYTSAFVACGARLQQGMGLRGAADGLFRMDGVERVYLLDADGVQRGHNVESGRARSSRDRRFDPCADVAGANWFRRPYFRRAIRQPNAVQVSRPYLSVRDAKTCVTLSLGIFQEGQLRVLCADVDWASGSALCDDVGVPSERSPDRGSALELAEGDEQGAAQGFRRTPQELISDRVDGEVLRSES